MSDLDPNLTRQGARLGPYAIIAPLGHGGMASVYEAVHIGLGKRVAIKVMRSQLAADETSAARFVREGRAVARVRHPHVVEVFDVGSHEGVPYLVMELLEGVDLAEYLKCNAPLPIGEAVDLMLPVLSAVSAAHEAGIVHRDLKPANVFLVQRRHGRPHPKVVDFGISTFMEKDGDLDLTQTQTMLGTVKYMSSEQTRGAKYADARSDQYSLGVMLYMCTTGQVPFTGEGVYEMIHAIRNAELVPPSKLNPALLPAFDGVVACALARAPADRYASVADFARALLMFAGRRSSASWEREFEAPRTDGTSGDPPRRGPQSSDDVSDREMALGGAPPGAAKEDATVMSTVADRSFARASRGRHAVLLAALIGTAAAAIVLTLFFTSRGHANGAGRPSAAARQSSPASPSVPLAVTAAPSPAPLPPTTTTTTTSSAPISSAASKSPLPHGTQKTPVTHPPPKSGSNGAPILE